MVGCDVYASHVKFPHMFNGVPLSSILGNVWNNIIVRKWRHIYAFSKGYGHNFFVE